MITVGSLVTCVLTNKLQPDPILTRCRTDSSTNPAFVKDPTQALWQRISPDSYPTLRTHSLFDPPARCLQEMSSNASDIQTWLKQAIMFDQATVSERTSHLLQDHDPCLELTEPYLRIGFMPNIGQETGMRNF